MFKPNREFQAGLNPDETRRRRQNDSLSLRRQDRESKLQKKRQRILQRSTASSSSSSSVIASSVIASCSNNELLSKLPKLVQGVMTSHPGSQFECVKEFRILLSQPNKPPIREVIDSGVIPRFIQLARSSSYPQLQYEALWALLNIASGPAECTACIIRNGSHNVFIDLLKSPLYEIREQSMWALGNIAGDGRELKDLLLNNNILPNILLICQSQFDSKYVTNFNKSPSININHHHGMHGLSQFISLFATTSWTLSNLCRASPPPSIQHLLLLIQCLHCLLKQALIFNCNKEQIAEILCNIGWGFSYLTGFDQYQQQLIDTMGSHGIIQQFVKLMDYENGQVRHSINRVIGNILTGSDENTKKCLNLGILNKYYRILKMYANTREKKEICWALSNITAGPMCDRILVLNNNLYPILIELLENGPYEVGKEALWAISNATTETDKKIIKPLVDYGVINALCKFLKNINITNNKTMNRGQNKILLVALECIENILNVGQQHLCYGDNNKYSQIFEENNGVQFLEDLQTDTDGIINEQVYDKCVDIITKYFDGEVVNDQNNNTLDYGINNNQNDVTQQDMQNSYHSNHDNNNNNNDNNNNNNNNNNQFGFGVNNGNNSNLGFKF